MELGKEWVAKNTRTVYKPLATPEQQEARLAPPPSLLLSRQGGREAAAAVLRVWREAEEEGRAGLLDLRPEGEYDAGHLVGATRCACGCGCPLLSCAALCC